MVQLPIGVAVLLLALTISVLTDPRKFRTGLYLLALLVWGTLTAIELIVGLVRQEVNAVTAEWIAVGLIFAVLATVLALAVFLIVTGVTLIRREGFAVARLLSIGLGAAMVGYLGLGYLAVLFDQEQAVVVLLLLGLPLGYLGFGFVAFMVYGIVYPSVAARRGGPVAAVVVLGSGLIRGRVPPLLAARLTRGQQLFSRFAYAVPVLVTSGGRGRDEPIAEAAAMADYLVDKGVPRDRIIVENRSRNTEQNIRYSAELLAERNIVGPIAAVTNNFHAFRAALLMRRQGLSGYSLGAPTARYYWPTAVIREYIAVLRDHRVLNIVLLSLSLVPAAAFVINLLIVLALG